jgi:hypothetical protein
VGGWLSNPQSLPAPNSKAAGCGDPGDHLGPSRAVFTDEPLRERTAICLRQAADRVPSWNVLAKWSVRVGLAWFVVLVAVSWYLGRMSAEGDSISVLEWVAIGLVFVMTLALGTSLVAERLGPWVFAAAFAGGFVATAVVSTAIFSRPNTLDSYYPQFVFVEFFVFLVVPLVIGAILAHLWRIVRRHLTKDHA